MYFPKIPYLLLSFFSSISILGPPFSTTLHSKADSFPQVIAVDWFFQTFGQVLDSASVTANHPIKTRLWVAKTLLRLAKNESPTLEIQKQRSQFPSLQLSSLFCARPRPSHDVEAVGRIPEEARLQDWVA